MHTMFSRCWIWDARERRCVGWKSCWKELHELLRIIRR